MVHAQVHVEIGGHGRVDVIEEPPKLDRAMAPPRLANQLPRLRVERGEPRGRALPTIFVRAPLRLPRSHRQQRRSAIEPSDLRFLIDTEDQRAIGRMRERADHIAHFLDQHRVLGQLAGLGAMELEAEALPDAPVRHTTQAGKVFAMSRVLPCVEPWDLVSSVRMLTSSTCASVIVRTIRGH